MQRVWKYNFWQPMPKELVDLQMPAGARLLSAHTQSGVPVLYALIDDERQIVTRRIRIAGTGFELGDNIGDYVGTFMLENDAFVFHVFDAGEVI